ncbi:hypothetical protein GH714_025109 [Hevea brasiliensis]|uniref:Uncharacterized protein n=1 Tax=Hevea brasiliensis TaxID=3981 RepID=A0A6A6MWX4_HEVBR|nr:hypothetical protein GH714_025109 [Hevea brasiliensis]
MLSYFSPLLKSIAGRGVGIYYAIIEEDVAEQEAFIEALESRFLFLAADARSTIRLIPSKEEQDKIMAQLPFYQNAEGIFGMDMAIRNRKKVSPAIVESWEVERGNFHDIGTIGGAITVRRESCNTYRGIPPEDDGRKSRYQGSGFSKTISEKFDNLGQLFDIGFDAENFFMKYQEDFMLNLDKKIDLVINIVLKLDKEVKVLKKKLEIESETEEGGDEMMMMEMMLKMMMMVLIILKMGMNKERKISLKRNLRMRVRKKVKGNQKKRRNFRRKVESDKEHESEEEIVPSLAKKKSLQQFATLEDISTVLPYGEL